MQVEWDGQIYVNFCFNDYLGLVNDLRVIKVVQDVIVCYGVGFGVLWFVMGGYYLLFELEWCLVCLKGIEDCIVFGFGYLVNFVIVLVLFGVGDLVLVDELVYVCIYVGVEFLCVQICKFWYNDFDYFCELLDIECSVYWYVMIMIDGVFFMDGDFVFLFEMFVLVDWYDVWILVDDVYVVGVVGDGKGLFVYFEFQVIVFL